MFSPFASTVTAGATLTAFLMAAATPCHADVPVPTPATPPAGVVFPGPVQVVPAGPPAAPAYPGNPQGYPQGYPQAYPNPQAYPAPAPGAYPPGYAPAYPYPPAAAPPPYGGLQLRTPVRYEARPMYSLIIAGSITFGASYLMTAGITGYINALECNGGSSHCSGVYWPLYIPVVGPFVYLGVGDRTAATLLSPALIISGIAQIGGLAMLIAGAVVRKKVPVYDDASRLTVAPYFSPTSSGLQAVGRF